MFYKGWCALRQCGHFTRNWNCQSVTRSQVVLATSVAESEGPLCLCPGTFIQQVGVSALCRARAGFPSGPVGALPAQGR